MSRLVPSDWEQAYLRFETPEQEVRKFVRRLRYLGAESWPRDARVVDLFCGRGGGARALERLGFTRVEGIDLSAALVEQYSGPSKLRVGDCRDLPFPDASQDVAVVQGGLHHLESLPDDLERTLAEIRRVLRPGGIFVAVEPWSTPFLKIVHAFCDIPIARRVCPRLDALASMIEYERATYRVWLSRPDLILSLVQRHFKPARLTVRLGKLLLVALRPERA